MKTECYQIRSAIPVTLILGGLALGIGIAVAQFPSDTPRGKSQGSKTKHVTQLTAGRDEPPNVEMRSEQQRIVKTPQEWRKQLTDMQFYVTREKGTERAFTGKYWNNKKAGTYTCVCCDQPLFESKTKFRSGTGWPSYYEPTDPARVTEITDSTWGMTRTEVLCSRCDAHLGHVFQDGPQPTGLRYCINSASLNFKPAEVENKAASETNELSVKPATHGSSTKESETKPDSHGSDSKSHPVSDL